MGPREIGERVKCLWTNRKAKAYAQYGIPARDGDEGVVTAIYPIKDATIVIIETEAGDRYSHIQNLSTGNILVPDEIKKAFDEYGFQETIKLKDALATRFTSDWFAILFKGDPGFDDGEDEDAGKYWAVDFRVGADGWEVQNDYVGPFKSIEEFKTEKLTSTLF